MEYPIKLRARATEAQAPEAGRILARVTFTGVTPEARSDCFLAIKKSVATSASDADFVGYAGVLIEDAVSTATGSHAVVFRYPDLEFLREDYVIAIHAKTGDLRILYRPESPNNSIFATGRCNSNCLMCSQPPTLSDDNSIVYEHLRLIDLIKEPPKTLGITGGEPTLLGEGLIRILERLKTRFPDTYVHMLTNGRLYAYEDFVRLISSVNNPNFVSAIPLYSDIPEEHDYVVQARGAFDQTMQGFLNAARYGLRLELRVVLHKQTVGRLIPLMEYIYRNLPFVSHIALMGLENMGYVKKNWELLWTDPVDYSETLADAVKHALYRNMAVSIYNLPLCVLPRRLWRFARKSISDYKNIYLEECERCDAKPHCSGLFASGKERHSRGVRPLNLSQVEVSALGS